MPSSSRHSSSRSRRGQHSHRRRRHHHRRSVSRSPSSSSRHHHGRYDIPRELYIDPEEPDWDDGVPDFVALALNDYAMMDERRQLDGLNAFCSPTTAETCTALDDSHEVHTRRHLDGLKALLSPVASVAPLVCTAVPSEDDDNDDDEEDNDDEEEDLEEDDDDEEESYFYYDYPAEGVTVRKQKSDSSHGCLRDDVAAPSDEEEEDYNDYNKVAPPSSLHLSRKYYGSKVSSTSRSHEIQEQRKDHGRRRLSRHSSRQQAILDQEEYYLDESNSIVEDVKEYESTRSKRSQYPKTKAPLKGSRSISASQEKPSVVYRTESPPENIGCSPFSLRDLVTPHRSTKQRKKDTSPKTVMEHDNDHAAYNKQPENNNLDLLRKELAAVMHQTSSDEPLSKMGTLQRRLVRFAHPLVTSLQYRPKTRPEDVPKLYFGEEELTMLEKDREACVADEQVECIAFAKTNADELCVSVAFPNRAATAAFRNMRQGPPNENVAVEI